MCGVIGLVYEKQRADLGRIAGELLRTLEYRGYDSTGAAIQGPGETVELRKGVGAPTAMVRSLGIASLPGQIFCGQVRWATFGAVTDENSQPHIVRCHTFLYGAHNGNITNCDERKARLAEDGHRVLSDNDGEMLVHSVEHCFARELASRPVAERADPVVRRAAMRSALCAAAPLLLGSYAAVIVDPVSRCLWAIKQGSSLYFGLGSDDVGGRFAIASSDLSSVLKLTRVVVPLREGEFVEFDASRHQLYALRDLAGSSSDGKRVLKAGEPFDRAPVRSRLRAQDTALSPPFETFMEQEIFAEEGTCRDVVSLFRGGPCGDEMRALKQALGEQAPEATRSIAARLDTLLDHYEDEKIRAGFHALVDTPELRELVARLPGAVADSACEGTAVSNGDRLGSSQAGFLADLLPMARDGVDVVAVRLLDALIAREETQAFTVAVERFVGFAMETIALRGRLFVVCCGSSYNAARAAAMFFNEVAHVELVPLLPGEFRERVSRSLADGDLLVAISQSGETKDLIDVMNDAIASGCAIRRVGLINNISSTLAEEKCDLVIPLGCGPEVAVPATKSFMNQLTVLFGLALRLAERRLAELPEGAPGQAAWAADLALRIERFPSLPALLRATVETTGETIEEAARLLYPRASIHLLGIRLSALAREGALKIREVVLNHAEGFEGSEFKHGANTILGFNTIFGLDEVEALFAARAGSDLAALLREIHGDYPLIYLTGPDERDVNLTVSQINTHKIRGSSSVVIAEEHPSLRAAGSKPPSDNPGYRSIFIALPPTGDTLMTVFSATVALQRLALRMSLLKMAHLGRLGIADHGVHPDVPKNVSKSITVD